MGTVDGGPITPSLMEKYRAIQKIHEPSDPKPEAKDVIFTSDRAEELFKRFCSISAIPAPHESRVRDWFLSKWGSAKFAAVVWDKIKEAADESRLDRSLRGKLSMWLFTCDYDTYNWMMGRLTRYDKVYFLPHYVPANELMRWGEFRTYVIGVPTSRTLPMGLGGSEAFPYYVGAVNGSETAVYDSGKNYTLSNRIIKSVTKQQDYVQSAIGF